MRLSFLGTGSAMPTGERFQTGLLLESGNDRLLVDCGSGVLHGLAGSQVGYEGVDAVLLSHHHLDHVSDLMVLLKARWLAGETDLTIAGPAGTRDLVDGLLDVHEYMQDRLDLSFREVEPGSFSLAGFDVDAMETRHSMDCLAYRFSPGESSDGSDDRDPATDLDGTVHPGDDAASDTDSAADTNSNSDPDSDSNSDADSDVDSDAAPAQHADPEIVFSGDSEAFTDLVEFADGAAILAHDCSFPDDVDVSNHPTPDSLGRVLAEADAEIGRVYLTHLYPHTDGHHEEMLDSIAEHYDGDVRFATDGLSVELS